MKITSLETLRLDEFYNVLWVRVGTDSGLVGLGETFYGAGAVEAHIHETLAYPTWFEDPIRMNSPQALGEYARATDVWVCASETLGSRWAYKEFLERDAIHVAMVDLCWTGGLTEGRKIAALAETWHRPFAPHDCTGPVAFAAAVHASVSQPNTLIQETVRAFYTGWYQEIVTEVPKIENGFVFPMQGVGLCLDLQPGVFERPDLHVRKSCFEEK